ncbi:MAG: radical SAM protein [Betaproteobacteria bacterium]|nr:radical SAM protein [Betaproteobacteria bacterium]
MDKYAPDDLVKTCPKLESGLRFGPEGVRACQLGPFAAPVYWSAREVASTKITKEMIVAKRQQLFDALNDDENQDIICKRCAMVEIRPYKEVKFTQLGRIDHAPRTVCNLRCEFCGFTHAEKRGDLENAFVESSYNSLTILKLFAPEDVQWDAAVDFNGGETSLIKNLKGYLDYFQEMKVSVLLFTNGVIFKQDIYDAITSGTIQWAVTSIDCGTPSTYKKTKNANVFGRVLNTVARYAEAGSKGKGKLAIKYIFTENNCSDDDIFGFVYAMLAIRPQRIWLTFDFTPFAEIPPDSDNFGRFNFDKQITAYAKMYLLFKQHGQDVVHYTEGHLAKISKPGRILLQRVLDATAEATKGKHDARLILDDFRNPPEPNVARIIRAALNGQVVVDIERGEVFDLKNKRVILIPATQKSIDLVSHPALANSRIVGFLDKNPNLEGKTLRGHRVTPYENAPEYDYALISPPSQHRQEIITTVCHHKPTAADVFVFD